jgi:iron(III) transport system ATP-binding protein
MTVSDRIVVMNEGKIMQVGTPTEIYSSPANMFVADFIGKVNLVYGKVKEINNNTVIVDYGTGTKAIKSNNEKFEKGRELITCVRPESLKLVKLDYTPKYLEEIISSIHSNAKKAIKKNNHGNMLLEGRIKTRVYLGPIVEYEIHVGKARSISAVVFNPIKEGLYNVGDYLGIDFPSNSARLLEN